MKKYNITPFVLSIILLIISIVAVGEEDIKPANQNISTVDEMQKEIRGVWVSYITLDMQNTDMSEESFKEKINNIINTTKNSGFNTLIMQVRPFSDALYKSDYYPWSHILTGTQGKNPGYDPLEIMCDMCHENGIYIHAWINPYRVSTAQTPKNLSEDNPYAMDNSLGFEQGDNIYLDPSNESARKLIINGVTEIAKNYSVDGIQFDDYFYPENSDAIDDIKFEKYKETEENPKSKKQWRKENVNELVKEVYNAVHKHSKNIEFGISPQGNINNNDALGADIKTWCEKEGYIDYIAPQIYFSLDNPTLTFEESLDEWLSLKLHNNLRIYVGLAGYKGGTDEDEGTWLDNNDILQNEIEISKEKGVDGVILYSYESFSNKENEAEIKNVVNYLTGIKE